VEVRVNQNSHLSNQEGHNSHCCRCTLQCFIPYSYYLNMSCKLSYRLPEFAGTTPLASSCGPPWLEAMCRRCKPHDLDQATNGPFQWPATGPYSDQWILQVYLTVMILRLPPPCWFLAFSPLATSTDGADCRFSH